MLIKELIVFEALKIEPSEIELAKHSKSPQTLDSLYKLTNHKFKLRFLYSLAGNTYSPKSVLEELSNHEYWGVRINVARNPKCPAEILDKLSSDPDTDVRLAVAHSYNCTLGVLQKLSNDNYISVRLAANDTSYRIGSAKGKAFENSSR